MTRFSNAAFRGCCWSSACQPPLLDAEPTEVGALPSVQPVRQQLPRDGVGQGAAKAMLAHLFGRNDQMLFLRLRHLPASQFLHELLEVITPALDLLEQALLATWAGCCQNSKRHSKEMARLAELAAKVLEADECNFFLGSKDQGGALVSSGSYGSPQDSSAVPPLAQQTFEAEQIYLKGSSASAPLVRKSWGSTCLGALHCTRRDGPGFARDEAEVLSRVAELCMPAAVNVASNIEAIRTQMSGVGSLRQQRADAEIIRLLASGESSISSLLSRLSLEVSRALRCDRTAVFLKTHKSSKLVPYRANQDMEEDDKPLETKWETLTDRVEDIYCAAKGGRDGLSFRKRNSMTMTFGSRGSVNHHGRASAINRSSSHSPRDMPHVVQALSESDPDDPAIGAVLQDKKSRPIGVLAACRRDGQDAFSNEERDMFVHLVVQVEFALNYALTLHDLRRERNLADAIFDSISNGIICVDRNGHVSKCNASAFRLIGLRSERSLVGFPIVSLFSASADDEAEVSSALSNALERRQNADVVDVRLTVDSNIGEGDLESSAGSESEGTLSTIHESKGTQNVRVNLTISPLMRLDRILKAYDVACTSASSGKDLMNELSKDGTSKLHFGSELLRTVRLAVLRLVSPTGEIFVEYSRHNNQTDESIEEPRLPAVMLRADETEHQAAMRCIQEKFPSIFHDTIEISKDVPLERLSERKESNSYVGVTSEYHKTFFQASIRQTARSSLIKSLDQTITKDGWTHRFMWLSAEELETLGLIIKGEAWTKEDEKKARLEKTGSRSSSNSLGGTMGQSGEENFDDELLGAIVVLEDISREKRLMATMTRYMDPKLAQQLVLEDQDALGGRMQDAIILFSDIRSFTTLSETLGPRETVDMLNEYFTEMVDCVTEHHGIVDKFIGDAIMAVWGVPFTTPEDADNALHAALAMLRRLDDLNVRRCKVGKEALRIGIGLNFASVVTGNVGSPRRMEYTVIGDGVNLASRLEAATKEYAVNILISDSTRAHLTKKVTLREIDNLVVKGKTEPSPVWEPVSVGKVTKLGLAHFRDGLQKYRRKGFTAARESFRKALTEMPDDGPSKVYIKRCELLAVEGTPKNWDGVWHLKTK